MKILDLLQSSDHVVWLQGHHTRLACFDNGTFLVTEKDKTGAYIITHYQDDSEEEAVRIFCEVENK